MSLKNDINADIISFFRDIEKQNQTDQIETLRILLDKHIHMSKSSFLMDKPDLETIISLAKKSISTRSLPVYLGKKKKRVFEEEQVALCIIESTIGFLNKNDCLRKLPSFDYSEDVLE